ncbi:hypothetical protein BCON_0001g00410 [Botryotinia convoluta]|uniref:SMP-30/Gluconolactonase/LRE-like region domain-containing protein n=1 Tax=Botryotinia convoluta TaxID=54673 RepID=A0A4Z1J9V7_9HELO|nr:hypothetical protein BCON_0001g00410 [Botryotinia convoluta]
MKASVMSTALAALTFLPSLSTCTPIASPSSVAISKLTPSLPLTVSVVKTFDFPSWCENFAIRSNGNLLVSRLDTPEVLLVSPTNAFEPITVTTFNTTTYKGALGISETTKDVFYVITSAQVDDSFVKTSGVNSIWKINMNTFAQRNGTITSPATVTKIVDIPGADFLNGMATLDDENVLVGDIYNGWVYKVCVTTGAYSIIVNDSKMKFPAGASTNLGVNGIKISNSYLYWTNTAVGTLNKIKIASDGTPIGSSSVVVSNVPKADDFIFKSDGTIWVAQNQMDELSYVPVGATQATLVAGSNISTTLAGVTSGHFGRTAKDANILYMATSGGLALPINGTVTVAGSIVKIDTTGF